MLSPVPIDLETTGLHIVDDAILEFAMLVATPGLEVVADFGSRVVHAPEEKLARMNDFVRETHTENGLLDAVRESTLSITEVDDEAAQFLIDMGFTASDSPYDRDLILLGSSCRLDLGMIERQMPKLQRLLHFRMIDCSGIREAVSMWAPELGHLITHNADRLMDEPGHRAHADARRTLEEAREQRSMLRAAVPSFLSVPTPTIQL